MFSRLGSWCHDRRWRVLILWLVAFFVFNGLSAGIGDAYRQDFSLEGFESTEGFDLLASGFPEGSGSPNAGTIVFQAPQGVNDRAVRGAMETLFSKVRKMDGVTFVESPYEPGGERLISTRGAATGKIAFANVSLPEDIDFTKASKLGEEIREVAPKVEGLRTEVGGYLLAKFEFPSSEVFGLAFAIVILILAFGSVLAMGLPVVIALLGIGIGGTLVVFASHLLEVPDFAPFIGLMIGLGVGIDYALLIITRYREELHAGHDVRQATVIAMGTAGRSVFFAGATVVISLLGMLLMNVGFVGGLGITASLTVAVTIAASLTLLPALLGFAGTNIERTKWRGLVAAGFIAIALIGVGLGVPAISFGGLMLAVLTIVFGFFAAPLKREVKHRPAKPRRESLAYRWSRVVQRRSWPAAIGASLLLLAMSIPVLSLRLGFADESNFADSTDTKQAYDLQVEGFGAGSTAPLLLVAKVGNQSAASLSAVNRAVEADPAVESLSPPAPNKDGTAVRWFLQPVAGPQDESTSDLVRRLRDVVLPSVEKDLGGQVLVTGLAAGNIDMSAYMSERSPIFFGAVLLLSFLLLMLVFRSLLVPLKAVIMNMLSIGAAYGVIVAVFQWGWGSGITGVQPGPIEAWFPMMLFAIVFGLSMDYEVFLLSRVREEWRRTGDSFTSVADGLAATAKVITAAAAIMVVVFGSFILEFDRGMKMMGLGLSVAILFDATIVRMLLVPATMELLGDRNWWLPRWLDRLLPNVDIEGHAAVAAPINDEPARADREPVLAEDTPPRNP